MTQAEWGPCAALLENLYKDAFDDVRAEAYYDVLHIFDAQHVRRAIVNITATPARPGQGAWIPSAREIATEVHALRAIGTWPWAYEQLRTLFTDHITHDQAAAFEYYRRGTVPDAMLEAVDALDREYAIELRAFIVTYGIRRLVESASSDYDRALFGREWARVQGLRGLPRPVSA